MSATTTTKPNSSTDETLTGVVERITYHAEDSGYTVAKMQVKGFRELVAIIGNFPNIQAGMTLSVKGYWYDHPKHGQQFQVKNYTESKPATLTGIEKYLGSGLIHGVGPVTAKRIVAHFQLETLEVIENQIKRLIEVPGIGKKRVKMIQPIEKSVIVIVDDRDVEYDYADLNEVALAWSISIHKSQGSEYPVVIMPISMSHYVMLSRNLVYTGLTRAKKLAIVVGEKKAIGIAVKQGHRRQRYTRLVERLKNP